MCRQFNTVGPIGIFLVLILLLTSCVDEFQASSPDHESILVVDARINDKVEKQQIFLSKTFPLSSDSLRPESNAVIRLRDNTGLQLGFNELSPGIYESESPIILHPQNEYQLEIQTSDGVQFTSSRESVPSKIPIEAINAKSIINGSDNEGVSVRVSTEVSSDSNPSFRYEYEETYQIVAPDYIGVEWDEVDYDFFMNDNDGWEVAIQPATEQFRVCYANNSSKDIVLGTTENTTGNSLRDFEVRFISKQNYFLANRYSILIKQYHHTTDAHSFYETLTNFSNFQSVFSNVQTGPLEGNISSDNDAVQVIGYFELSSYSEKRAFFGFRDFYPEEPLPSYPINCSRISKLDLYPEGFHFTIINGEIVLDGVSNSPLIDAILTGQVGFFDRNPDYVAGSTDEDPDRAPYLLKPLGCVDCRALGSTKQPDFWIESNE